MAKQTTTKQVVAAKPATTVATATPVKTYKTYSSVTTQKRAVIIYAHPYAGSFAGATLAAAKKGLEQKGKQYDVIDLHADQFDPVYHGPQLAVYSKGIVVDDLAKKYGDMIRKADELIIIYPIWWSGMPAILKGFFDKVFLEGDFWVTKQPTGVFPFLWGTSTWIKRVSVFTTSFTPNFYAKLMMHFPAKHQAGAGTLKAMRMRGVRFYNLDRVKTRSRANKERHLAKVTRICARELYK